MMTYFYRGWSTAVTTVLAPETVEIYGTPHGNTGLLIFLWKADLMITVNGLEK